MKEGGLSLLEEEVTLVLVNNGKNKTGNLLNILENVGKELVSLGLYNSFKVKQTETKPHKIYQTNYLTLSEDLEKEFEGENVVALLNGELFHTSFLSYNNFAITHIGGCGDKTPIASIESARRATKGNDFDAALALLLHEVFEQYYWFRIKRGANYEEHENKSCALSHKNLGPRICSNCKEWLKEQKRKK